ncbi:MAG: hypothetical protein ACK2UP_16230 [Candidatus Promineifilaceae bacterium]
MQDKTDKQNWVAFIKHAIDEYRKSYPNDPRSDEDLFFSLMDQYVEQGIVYIKDGKYILPKIIHDA